MELEFDIEEEELLKILDSMTKKSNKLVKKHLKKVGKNMTKEIKKSAKRIIKVGKKQKNPRKKYHNKFKTSRVLEENGTLAIGTYNSSPHAHLIEYGYKHSSGKFISGKYPIAKGLKNYNNKLKKDLEEVLDNVIKEGGF